MCVESRRIKMGGTAAARTKDAEESSESDRDKEAGTVLIFLIHSSFRCGGWQVIQHLSNQHR